MVVLLCLNDVLPVDKVLCIESLSNFSCVNFNALSMNTLYGVLY